MLHPSCRAPAPAAAGRAPSLGATPERGAAGGAAAPRRGAPCRTSWLLSAYVVLACLAAGAALAMLIQDPRLLPEPATVLLEPGTEALVDAAGGRADETPRAALERRARSGDAEAALALGRLLAVEARRDHDLGRVSDAASWLDQARRHGRAEAATELTALADRYCGRHELLADRLCAD